MAIQLQQVSFGYQPDRLLFQDLSMSLPEQGAVLFTGPSGCGKTTLLRLIAGLLSPQSGRITGTAPLTFSWVFQQDRLLPWATVWQNAALAGERALAKTYLEALGLGQVLQAYPQQLSGGMARRLAIARALAYGGQVALLDEAFTGLDPANQQLAAALLAKRFPLVLQVSHQAEAADLFPHTQVQPLV